MMIIFTVVGMLVVALMLGALAFAVTTALLSGRVGNIQTSWRRYSVSYPDTSQDPHGPFNTYTNYWLDKETSYFFFLTALRAAVKVCGTRIFDRWRGTFSVARPGWSESRNGYIRDRDVF